MRWEVNGSTAAILYGAASRDLLKTACMCNFPSSFFSWHFVQVQVVQPYNSTDNSNSLGEFPFYLIWEIRLVYKNKQISYYFAFVVFFTSCEILLKSFYLFWQQIHLFFHTTVLINKYKPNNFLIKKKSVFFLNKDARILWFLVKHYTIKMNIIWYYKQTVQNLNSVTPNKIELIYMAV